MQKHFPHTDFVSEYPVAAPWNEIANKIGFMHGKYLCTFWESKVKYINEDGKLRFKRPGKLPSRVMLAAQAMHYCIWIVYINV